LVKLENAVLTPHIGATTEAAFNKASQEAAHKVSNFFAKQAVTDLLPSSAAWYALIP
jgi:phosphoglycerate dehydrogenase-like enzyme